MVGNPERSCKKWSQSDIPCHPPLSSGIPFSAMRSGRWKIVLSGRQISSQRSITLTVGVPQTTWVTVRGGLDHPNFIPDLPTC